MSENKLTTRDIEYISQNEKFIGEILKDIEKAKMFKLGDYLVAQRVLPDIIMKQMMITNTYGVIKKFKVIHIDNNHVRYVKALDKNNRCIDELYSLAGNAAYVHYNSLGDEENVEFMLDPDYAEAIIFQVDSNYDPSEKYKKVSKLRSEIIKFNKSIKIITQDLVDVIVLMNKMKTGETYWTSNKSCFAVADIKHISNNSKYVKLTGTVRVSRRKFPTIPVITVKRSNGKTQEMIPENLWMTNIYTSQPRSLNELKNPI